jgi:transposase
MAKPYSDDFRRTVIQAIEVDGLKKSAASKQFKISRNTIDLWFQRKAQTGDIKPKQRIGPQCPPKINDLEKFAAFVQLHPGKTQRELAELWDDDVSQSTISRALAKLRRRQAQ